jgi:adenylate cyclase
MVIVAVATYIGSTRTRSTHQHDAGSDEHAASPAKSGVRTVAVLPFRSLSGATADEAWGIGITDAIITRLATLQNRAVRPTSSVLKYVKTPTDPSQAAQELQVDSIGEGTYQRAGGAIRVSVQLIDQKEHSARWAEHYDLRADDMLKFQDAFANPGTW